MANGKPGDSPYTDIVTHGVDSYSPQIARLIREIDSLCDDKMRRELENTLLNEYSLPSKLNLDKLERILTKLRDKLLRAARARGFEI